jgi:hypothetical protein
MLLIYPGCALIDLDPALNGALGSVRGWQYKAWLFIRLEHTKQIALIVIDKKSIAIIMQSLMIRTESSLA